jgi:hypothetical protein
LKTPRISSLIKRLNIYFFLGLHQNTQ